MARTIPRGWRLKKIKEIGKVYSGGTPSTNIPEYWNGKYNWCIPTDITALKGYKYLTSTGKKISELGYKNSGAQLLPPGSIVVCTRATIGDCAINLEPMTTNQGFKSIVPNKDVICTDFLYYQMLLSKTKLLRLGNGSTFLEVTKSDFEAIEILVPESKAEQKKIAEILSTWDRAIETLDKLIEAKTRFKKGLMQKLLTGKVRFKGFKGKWKTVEIGEVVDYERPDKYVVDSILEFDKNKIPVLTANKSFILGSTDDISGIYKNLPVIIFDDFTTDSKYVDFPFKVKSSAIKLLKPKNDNVNLRFIYESMKNISFPRGKEHKRFFISEYQYFTIDIPDIVEQKKVASILSNVDSEIDCFTNIQEKLKSQKQGLMQKLLTGKIRVYPVRDKVK